MLKSALLGALLAVTAAAAWAEDPTADTVVATVNGKAITLGHMIAMRESLPPQYLQLDDKTLFDGILDQIIQQEALAEVAEAQIGKREALMLDNQRRGYLSGVTLDETAAAAVTDESVQALFDEKYSAKEPGKEYSAAHILVATEDEAKTIKAELDGGADFAAIAKEKSTDRGSAAAGGDLGWFGVGMMVKPFEDAVIAMNAGEISAPVESQFGWHIIRLNEVRTAAKPTIEDVRAELEGELQGRAVEARVTELTGAAKVEKTVDGIDPAVLKNVALIDN
ncbi:MAG: peptidylprolyl isomerase [Bauldia sp.]|jgi:peptidyl-prolyl cis-trans isomerase C|uniref:peptidylprolyl isomerase n=1 Tax=Albidovulum sp. TaxID=1872424 RepID=UPI001D24C535|nr:peptidylprolyl isomerase [uncultured Defluviimonas sp.]MCB1501436.1 peptidylprolyl isomerase [Bauldia sp.]MCC0070771.1 peptidylprolyl isomerase [Paracoccaceae bacterium]